jgi:glyoxylase-like metal-dependent hydrolase (beta-lactamase superfamily II)
VLIETGPSTTLPTLLAALRERGVRPGDIEDVLVTHIHLDHAGAAGWWARQGARVWVHAVGAPHLVDPGKLLASATRIYGDRMDMLWGEVPAAPVDRVHAVADGDVIEAGGMTITAIDTPGHAWHHHVFRIGEVAFAGDATGIRLPGQRWIDLPAPPPEFDLEAWKATLAKLRRLNLRAIHRTHFGSTQDVAEELDGFERILDRSVEWIREMLERGLERDAMVAEFSTRMRDLAFETGLDESEARAYELANPRVMSVDGITRYLRKKADRA